MQNRSKTIAVSNTAHQAKAIFMLSMGVLIAAVIIFASTQVNAQDKVKPKLVPIILDEKTNDPKALEIARKLDPDFFVIDQEYMGGSLDAKFFARFLPLDKNNANAFIAVATQNNPMYCGSRGCPTRIFNNRSANQWIPVLDLIVNKMWFDQNTQNNSRNNIITQNTTYPDKATAVWMWSTNKYIKVNRK